MRHSNKTYIRKVASHYFPNPWVGYQQRPAYYLRAKPLEDQNQKRILTNYLLISNCPPGLRRSNSQKGDLSGASKCCIPNASKNQMETCVVHLDGTLFLPAQGRTPRVPVKAAKGSRAECLQASSFIRAQSKQASYRRGSAVISA